MKTIKPCLQIFLFTIPVIILTLYSCASKPNIPYPGTMSENYSKLEQWNPLLASEIRKLPEFQDGIAIQEEKALNDLVELYTDNPKMFSNAFKQMYQIGIPEVRKYCSPLQALFWLVVDGRITEADQVIKDYTLRKLLVNAWKLNNDKLILTTEQISMIIENIKDDTKKKYYNINRKNCDNKYIQDLLAMDYRINRKIFSTKAKKTIKKNLFQNIDKRWYHFSTVVDRLNSPKLLDIYINTYYTYIFDHRRCQSPQRTFIRKKGCCVCLAFLGQHCLIKSGYKTSIRHLKGNRDQHGVLVVKSENKYYIVVDYTSSNRNRLSGPFNNISEVDSQIQRVTGTITYQRRYITR